MHSTSNLEDGYVGSGKRLWYSIKKYGKDNFKCEILEFLPNKSSLSEREKELVNEDFLKNPLCLNLGLGGGGGHGSRFLTKEQLKKGRKKSDETLKKKYGENFKSVISKNYLNNLTKEQRNILNEKIKNGQKSSGFDYGLTFRGKKHKIETIEKLKGHTRQNGEKNSQYGKPRSEETKKKIKESILKRFGITNGISNIEKNKLKRDEEIKKYTIDGVFYNIRRRKMIYNIFNIDIELNPKEKLLELNNLLFKLYIIEKKSTVSISKIFNTSDETIRNYLIVFKIERRNIK